MAEAGDHGLEELHLEQVDTSEELVPTEDTPGDTPGAEATNLPKRPLMSDQRN